MVYTDHISLQYLMKLAKTPAKAMRWIDRLSDYDFQIIHISGITNTIADMLSR